MLPIRRREVHAEVMHNGELESGGEEVEVGFARSPVGIGSASWCNLGSAVEMSRPLLLLLAKRMPQSRLSTINARTYWLSQIASMAVFVHHRQTSHLARQHQLLRIGMYIWHPTHYSSTSPVRNLYVKEDPLPSHLSSLVPSSR